VRTGVLRGSDRKWVGWYVRSARFRSSGVYRLAQVGALLVCCALAPRVCAQRPERIATLRLDADATCVSLEGLRARIVAPAWHLADASEAGAQLALGASVLRESEGGLLVRLEVQRPGQRKAQRALAAQSCEASLDALALLVQMTLDAADVPARARAREPRWHRLDTVLVGASFGLASGAAPTLQPGLGVFAALGLLGRGFARPWLQLEWAHAWSNGHASEAGQADFALDGGQALLCPIAWGHARFAAHGCGAFELARLRARGYDTFEPRAHSRVWASVGAGLLVRVGLWKLDWQLSGALVHPLSRDQFSFAPDVFFSVPSWRWQLKFGVGVRFL